MASLSVEQKELHTPSLEEVAEVLQEGLRSNFAEATCEVAPCPDLSAPPFGLASEGICGFPRIGEVGGMKYLTPLPQMEKVYDLKYISKLINLPDGLIIGAGAGPYEYIGKNCELIPNMKTGQHALNETRITKVMGTEQECILEKLPQSESRCAILCNFFASSGIRGNVIKISAKNRTGKLNLVSCMRQTLEKKYGTKPVGMGGTFLLKKGQAKIHVMPSFSETPIESEEQLNQWLKFFDMKAPMVFMSVFVSHDPDLDFRLEHTHGYNHLEGGHYHFDTTPKEVEYEGYFNVAELIYRIDKPPQI